MDKLMLEVGASRHHHYSHGLGHEPDGSELFFLFHLNFFFPLFSFLFKIRTFAGGNLYSLIFNLR